MKIKRYPHRLTPLKAIRAFCLQCVCESSPEVKLCPSTDTCPLWPHRFGKNPTITGKTSNPKGREALKKYNKGRATVV